MGIIIRALAATEIDEADRIFREAFSKFIGIPDPAQFSPGRDFIGSRYRANPELVLAAEVDGRLAGTNVLGIWGSFGYFGPLTVSPEFWNAGVGSALLGPTMDLFAAHGTTHEGLFTFANSPKHFGLYRKFGFWPRYLTAMMGKSVASPPSPETRFETLSSSSEDRFAEGLRACRELTDALLEGLDLALEIRSVAEQGIGATIVVPGESRLDSMAVCHFGQGSEAAPGSLYVKFAAARPGIRADRSFSQLLDSIEGLAIERGLGSIEAGVNLAHEPAWRVMSQHGYATKSLGVAMQRPNADGYKRREYYVVDDWR